MTLRRRVVVVWCSGVVLGGCVLLVDPIEAGDHCLIQGASPCAECIRKSCEEEIDACCASAGCSGSTILSEMDACGRDDVDACLGTMIAGRITTSEETLRSCASTSCRSVCTVGAESTGAAPRAKWTCETPREPVSDCASCVYDACGAALDACCDDSSCKNDETIKVDLGACITNDARGCAYAQTKARSTSGQAGVVRGCIRESCASCLGDGLTHTDCALLNRGAYCQCSPSPLPGDRPCTAKTVSGECVEAKDGCSCGTYGCSETSSGCTCSFVSGDTGASTSCAPFVPSSSSSSSSSGGASADPVCCIVLHDTYVSCECLEYTTSCDPDLDEYDVTSCDVDVVEARLGARVTSSCSR